MLVILYSPHLPPRQSNVHSVCICPKSKSSWWDSKFDGRVFITLTDFLFSAFSLSLEMELPFLKFIRYKFTEKSLSAKAVKKLWSQQVVEILNILFTS